MAVTTAREGTVTAHEPGTAARRGARRAGRLLRRRHRPRRARGPAGTALRRDHRRRRGRHHGRLRPKRPAHARGHRRPGRLPRAVPAQTDQGPCLDCYREGHRVDVRDMSADAARWPQVVPFALEIGFRAAHALPLRVHGQTVGAVNLLLREPGGLAPVDLDLAQALADVSAVALVNRSPEPLRSADVAGSVQAALAGRAAVSMATGMIAEVSGLSLAEAHGVLRAYSAGRPRRLVDTAHALIRRTLTPDDVLATRS
ncbi:GAF and ANTAR domain-containing protein [Streptomyces sp. DSM 118148]|uniref:GAF and ANTAR domain-containing protein n=1 Tax=Streptomyces sp. DSM 118148 TaxID=3448667 RepID=UPI00403FE971